MKKLSEELLKKNAREPFEGILARFREATRKESTREIMEIFPKKLRKEYSKEFHDRLLKALLKELVKIFLIWALTKYHDNFLKNSQKILSVGILGAKNARMFW